MIRKTFICVAGILVGASTGAYFDGFFEQENAVTNAYHQIASQFNSSQLVSVGGEDSASDAQNMHTAHNSMADKNTTLAAADPMSKATKSHSDSEKSDADGMKSANKGDRLAACLLYTSPSPRDQRGSRMPSSA